MIRQEARRRFSKENNSREWRINLNEEEKESETISRRRTSEDFKETSAKTEKKTQKRG
jgi:hypothetical protein